MSIQTQIQSMMLAKHVDNMVNENARADALRDLKRDPDFKKELDKPDERATAADVGASKFNPITQLRKVLDTGSGTITFANKKSIKLKGDEADKILKGFDLLKKPNDKVKFQNLIGRSPEDLKKILKLVSR
tara:strand:+ start:183 stop:575 length:393 start_codon:yes stop_codon:yes gene_type:complete